MINPMDMTGKTIIVTGASSGIGRATAIQISQLGGTAILVARDSHRLEQTISKLNHGNHKYYSFDLLNHAGIDSLIKRIVTENGEINGLAYCAGIGNRCPSRMLKPEKLLEMLKINSVSFVEAARVLSSTRYRSETASFVCISSVASIKGEKGLLAYSMSKGALNSAIRVMAKEFGPYGIRVNAVLPSWIKTEMAESIFENYGKGEFDKEMDSVQYLGMGSPIDIANAIVFLLSDAAKFITGTELIIDGGYTS
ncbi:SDR family NAD(P)-dependent oxidoreductase [Cloacibacillus evryensis]|uniref:SDR family oxidoreductase n=1 Tax=Cloacibacillus evryensis TaxID=508460 RepID=A0AAW5K440_9BACT|nr:SDR family oxidoreductase [Cloacibacillus evryensis]MCQ4814656.1 SDR family oxidoreductase [Cloacibacillus evryensis]